jgi:signal transduction histidine kinase
LENARLYEDLAERERRLESLVERLVATQEDERRRVAYESTTA